MIAGTVTIANKLGLHARAASRLVNCASGYASEIRILRGARSINAKSIMGVLTLAAARGAELVIEVEGASISADLRLYVNFFQPVLKLKLVRSRLAKRRSNGMMKPLHPISGC